MDRNNGLSLGDLVKKYPHIPRFNMLKIDLNRRGVMFTEEALELAKDEKYQYSTAGSAYGDPSNVTKRLPQTLLLRDGSSIFTWMSSPGSNPYTIDFQDGKFVILDNGELVEEVDFAAKPDFYGKKTSRGIPMENIMIIGPQMLYVCFLYYCYYHKDQQECKYCSLPYDTVQMHKAHVGRTIHPTLQDIAETVREALKEQGKWTKIGVSGGSDPRGNPPFEKEVNYIIEIFQEIGKNFNSRRFPSYLCASAFSREHLIRIYEETGVVGYMPDIEVWDEKLFEWICPGKAKFVGREKWIESLISAVDIFGEGNVATIIVAGIEMAQPYGFKTEDEALASNLAGAEFLAQRGIPMIYTTWCIRPGTYFYDRQEPPSLEYYVRLTEGLYNIWDKYGLYYIWEDWRHCGGPQLDIQRIRNFHKGGARCHSQQ